MSIGQKLWYDVNGLGIGIDMWNMKVLSFAVHRLRQRLKFFVYDDDNNNNNNDGAGAMTK